MPTVLNRPHYTRDNVERTPPQKVSISLGVAFLIIGILGILMPGLMGMHLSMSHNLVHILSGALAIWCGSTTANRAFNFCVGFGLFYGLLGIAGFLLGEPGFPGMGNMEADQNLFRVIPNFLEFGTIDHFVHLLISAFLLFTTYTFRKDRPAYKGSR